MNWKRIVNRFIHSLEGIFDWLKYRIGWRINGLGPIKIIPYLGYGSENFINLRGRVLEDKGITPSKDSDRIFNNLLNMYRRFESDEIPHARVLARFRDFEQQVMADEEGCFELKMQVDRLEAVDIGWQEVDLELIEPVEDQEQEITAVGEVLIISSGAEFGVISDIDDTIIYTGVSSKIRMAYTVLLKNAYSRLPLKGVADFYYSLQRGRKGQGGNPLFYVSSSPWNMYDLFREFFTIHGIPIGPIFLRDWGFERETVFTIKNRGYKMGVIRNILDGFPDLKFILIGDSGEQDPEIYAELIQMYPLRILAAYIRSVRPDQDRAEEIQALADQVTDFGSVMLLARDSHEMAEHAIEMGWIKSSSLSQPGD